MFDELRTRPSVLVIDDLHWADQGTIDLLRFVLRRIRLTGSLVVLALRADEIGPTHRLCALLGDVARSPDATTVALRPLSVDAIHALAAHRPVDPVWLRDVTGGNPFFVVEMIEHDGDDLPGTVRDAVLARTAVLSPQAWDLLHLLACAPESIPDHSCRASASAYRRCAWSTTPDSSSAAVEGLVRHDLCRLAISSTIPPGGEVSFHTRMLEALETTSSADPAVLAHHAAAAGDTVRTRRYATQAGRAAGAIRRSHPSRVLRTAVEQGSSDSPADEAELLELLADESYLIDRLDDAIVAGERAMALRRKWGRRLWRREHQPPRAVGVPVVQRVPWPRRGARAGSSGRVRGASPVALVRRSGAARSCVLHPGLPRDPGQRGRAGADAVATCR